MTTTNSCITAVLRWGIVIWIAYCAIEMIRWRHFEVQPMVAGWFWMGSVLGWLLSWIGSSNNRRSLWGARVALIAPILLLLMVFFRTELRDKGFNIGPSWLWHCWCLIFDLALLTWGWTVSGKLDQFLRSPPIVIGLAGLTIGLATGEINTGVIVMALAMFAIALLSREEATPRPHRWILATIALIAIDSAQLIDIAITPGDGFAWGLLDVARVLIVGYLGWKLSRSPFNRIDGITVASPKWLSALPVRTLKVGILGGLFAWTAFACWLFPRCVATFSNIERQRGWRLTSSANIPSFLGDRKLLADLWRAALPQNDSLYFERDSDDLPEIVLVFRELRSFHVNDNATDEMLISLHDFPHLEEVRIRNPTKLTRTGMDALSRIPTLKRLEIWRGDLDFADFAGFDAHPELNLKLWLIEPNLSEGNRTNAIRGIRALAGCKSLDLTIESDCDEELARQLCEIRCIGDLSLRSCRGLTAATFRQLCSSQSLKKVDIHLHDVGSTILLPEIVDVVVRLPTTSRLFVDFNNSPLTDADLDALDQISESPWGQSPSHRNRSGWTHDEFGLDIGCTVQGDEHFRRLCESDALGRVHARVLGISERGLMSLSQQNNWRDWHLAIDLRESTCAACQWTELIPKELNWQIIISSDAIQTEADATGLRSLGHQTRRIGFGYPDRLHVVCNAPTVETLNRLKRLSFPARLVLDFSDQNLTIGELTELVEAIPNEQFDIDLRLPYSVTITETNSGALAALARLKELRLEITIDNSAMSELAKLPGLTHLNLRESPLGFNGFRWLAQCQRLQNLRIQPAGHMGDLLSVFSHCVVGFHVVKLEQPRIDEEFQKALAQLRKEWKQNRPNSLLHLVLIDVDHQKDVIEQLKRDTSGVTLTIERSEDEDVSYDELPLRSRKPMQK